MIAYLMHHDTLSVRCLGISCENKPMIKWSLTVCVTVTQFPHHRKIFIYLVINYVYILHADDAGLPPSTVINQNETFAKVIFKPSVVQQARIAQNGVLGDFIIRYDVSREQSIGDIQVRGLLLLFYVSCLILLLRLRTRDFNTYLRDRGFSDS